VKWILTKIHNMENPYHSVPPCEYMDTAFAFNFFGLFYFCSWFRLDNGGSFRVRGWDL